MPGKLRIPGTRFRGGRRWAVEPVVRGESVSNGARGIRYEFLVVDTQTGHEVLSFRRVEVRDESGSVYSGVRSLEVTPDEAAVVVTYEDGTTERRALPVSR